MDVFNHESLKLQFKLDNEFELVFVVVYQRILQLSYMDKLIDQVYIAFRDRYKTHLSSNGSLPCPAHYDDFSDIFKTILDNLEQEHKLINQRPREMKQWDGGSRKKDKKFINGVNDISTNSLGGQRDEDTMEENGGVAAVSTSLPPSNKLKKLMAARNGSKSGGGGTNKGKKGGGGKVVPSGPPKKEARQWMGVVSKDEAKSLDYTNGTNGDDMGDTQSSIDVTFDSSPSLSLFLSLSPSLSLSLPYLSLSLYLIAYVF
jgi:signal recognition particle receptor subunit alpha